MNRFWSVILILIAVFLAAFYTSLSKKADIVDNISETATSTPMINYISASPKTHNINMEVYKSATTTLFWIGEKADSSNNFISNDKSAWDEKWLEHYGGPDDPKSRCGFKPCASTPKENSFYVALPYFELDNDGNLKETAKLIPWFNLDVKPLLKNRWVEISYNDKMCYGQWEDVGPVETDDYQYVFGSHASPKNTFGEKAGLDISPAIWQCLGLSSENVVARWRFISENDVPLGPWKEIVTMSPISYTHGN